jgi:hypothetical protein
MRGPVITTSRLPSGQSQAPYAAQLASTGSFSSRRFATRNAGIAVIFILSLLMSVPAFAQVPTKDPAGIFDGRGNFNAAAYVHTAQDYGTAEMIPERFGPASTGVITTTVPAAANLEYFNPLRPAEYFFYSLGTPCQPDGDYSSNYAQVAYIFDPTVQRSVPGVDGIQTLDVAHCVWAGQPQLAWQTGGGHGGQPTIILRSDIVARLDPYGTPQQPVEVVRAYGASEDAACSYMVFQSGQIVCGEGGNTAKDYFYSKPFPTNFTPTAATVTNNGEFLLVVGWNTTTMNGQLAVLAMGSSKPTGTFWSHEWDETYPGFRNYSLPVFSKLLGIIDLPGMVAPTMVNAVGNWEFQFNLPGQTDPGKFPLSVQANWRCFAAGSCMKLYDTSGFALVGSRYERKVLLLNLAPLFKMVTAGMFTDFATFRAHVVSTGINPGQWPPTFTENPAETPVVVKTILYPVEVTAVSSSVGPDNRALIATLDGQVHIWDVDGLQTGGTGANAHEVSTVTTGFNTTRLANMKHGHGGDRGSNGQSNWHPDTQGLIRNQWLALSRGERKVSWIDFSTGTAKVIQTLRDSRLVDPISVEDNNNHGTQSDLIDIADYGARDVKAYRYGPVIIWGGPCISAPGGCPIFGPDTFEYEGNYATPTGPFDISIENVP